MLQVCSCSTGDQVMGERPSAKLRQLQTHTVASIPCPWPPLTRGECGWAGGQAQLCMAWQHQC